MTTAEAIAPPAAVPYCGDPPMRVARLFARDADGGVPALFAGRRVAWSFNARVAIRAACDVLGLRPGDEVLAPAYNCGSDLDPLVHAGLAVTLYPVGRDTRVDPEAVARLIGPRTRAVYVTHYFGALQPELAALRALCDDHGLRLIEDCALSLLSGAAPAEGRVGDVAVFCLYKFFPTLAGGALVVNAPDLALPAFGNPPPRRVVTRTLARQATATLGGPRALKAARTLKARLKPGPRPAPSPASTSAPASAPAPGLAPGAADIPAHYYFDPALQDARISAFAARPIRAFDVAAAIAARRANWGHYMARLDGMAGVSPLLPALDAETCPLNMPVLVEDRDTLARALQARGIAATPWWAGYNRNLDWTGQDDAAWLKERMLALPAHQFLGEAHVAHICDTLRDLIR